MNLNKHVSSVAMCLDLYNTLILGNVNNIIVINSLIRPHISLHSTLLLCLGKCKASHVTNNGNSFILSIGFIKFSMFIKLSIKFFLGYIS